MLGAALIAFGHFIAFFGLTAALVLQLALLRTELNVESARRILRADLILRLSAVLLLLFGFLRVFYFEKGSDYYFSNTFFQLKLLLFIIGGLLSLYPTVVFRRWNAELQQENAPIVAPYLRERLKKIVHWELIVIAGIMLCASLMAKGFGQ